MDKRQAIIDAALGLLSEEGYAGFSQPKVAARAGVRQSHLTYYFPTRLALLEAVADVAVERRIEAVGKLVAEVPPAGVPAAIAKVLARKENTRVFVALVQASDQEPSIRRKFRELAAGMMVNAEAFLRSVAPGAPEGSAYALHALLTGLAVLDLAADRPGSEKQAAASIELLVDLFRETRSPAQRTKTTRKRKPSNSGDKR